MIKKFNWEGFSNQERNKVIEDIKDRISVSDGYILNFQLYSDLALSLSIEIEEASIVTLYEKLAQVITLSPFDFQLIDSTSKKECLLFLNLSFAKGSGKLKIKIPSVPG